MSFLHYSSNVITAKARAMYGKSLKPKDYTNLLNCHSVSESAAYLKNNTAYAGVLRDVNEATIHRGYLEMLLRRKLYNDYAALARYDVSVGLQMSRYLMERAEIELIVSCLRLLSAGRASEFYFSMPLFFTTHSHLNLQAMSRSKSFGELLEALYGTVYHEMLERYPPGDDGLIRLTEIETALYSRLSETMMATLKRQDKETAAELIDLYGTYIDVQNVTRIQRLKRYFEADPETIRRSLLPGSGAIPVRLMEQMVNAPTADAVMDILYSSKVGRRIPAEQRRFVHDLYHRVPFFNARRHIHLSVHAAVVMLSYIMILDVELDDIINVIEGIRYGLQPEDIKPMLVLAET